MEEERDNGGHSRATDGSRFVAERARVWLTEDGPAAVAPALPVIDLGRGEMDRPTAPHILAAVADALDRGETHYTSRPGIAPLRHALAGQLAAETGIAYDPQREILISSGAQEGLFVAVQMLVRPGDEVLLADPGYPTMRTPCGWRAASASRCRSILSRVRA